MGRLMQINVEDLKDSAKRKKLTTELLSEINGLQVQLKALTAILNAVSSLEPQYSDR